MSDPVAAREALIVEAIGEAAELVDSVTAMTAALQNVGRGIAEADAGLRESLAGFERRVMAITDNAKIQTVKYVIAKTEEATRRSIDQQGRAMADAARVAFGAEVGATMQRWQATLQSLLDQRTRRWEAWLTHAAAAAVASAATSVLMLYLGHG